MISRLTKNKVKRISSPSNHSYLFLGAFILCGIFWFFPTVQAQQQAGVQVKPALFEERVNPGDVYESVLRVTNLSDFEQTYYLNKRDISYMTDTGQPIFAQVGEVTGFEMSSWIELPESVSVPVGGTTEVSVTIRVPADATPGGHFAGIFVTTEPVEPETTGSGVGYQVATVINMRISGQVTEEVRIREFRTDKKVYSKPIVKFITRVENLGNVLVRPRGPVEITNMFGKKVGLLRMNDTGGGIFPGAEREFEVTWIGEGFHIGRYQALMGLVYGEEVRQNVSATVTFNILPLRIILPVVGGLIFLILAVYIFIRLYIRKKVREIDSVAGRKTRRGVQRPVAAYRRSTPFPRLVFLTIGMLLLILILMMVLFFFVV